MEGFMEKYVLITGVSKGLGLCLVQDFLKEGYVVIGCYRSMNQNLEQIKEKYSENLKLVEMDVSSEVSVKNAFHKVKEITDAIEILINNAAVYLEIKSAPIYDIDIDNAVSTLNINAVGPLRVLKYFYSLVENGSQKIIVNVSSEAGSISDCWRDREFSYCMSKSALNMLTKILYNFSKDKGIKVVSIHPGWMKTDMGGKDADIYPEEASEGIIKFVKKIMLQKELNHQYFDYKGNPMKW
jgi:NAD(P)-dependent dehydrogenase (short-subunit alcohol dehydrogenase family)